MRPLPRISIVVVSHNGGDLARRAIDSAVGQSYPDHEVIVVDNGSDDDSLTGLADSPTFQQTTVRCRLLRLPRNLGCAGGRNAGIQAAEGEMIAFLDADAVAPTGWLGAVAELMASSASIGIVASTSLSMRNPRVIQSQGGVLTLSGHAVDLGFGEPWEFTQVDEAPIYAMGNGLVARRELFEQVGRFDEACRNYYEDVDFCLRAKLAGYEVVPLHSEPLLHYGGYSDEIFHDKAILLERHRLRTALKSYGGGLLARWLLYELGALVWGGAGARRRVRLGAWGWNLARLSSVLEHRARFRPRVRSAASLPAMRPSWGPARSLEHSVIYTPESCDLEAGIELGEENAKAIAYGFYWAEDGHGERFRWTNGLGSLLVRSARPIRNLALRMHFSHTSERLGGLCLAVLMDRARDVYFAGRIEATVEGWQDYKLALDAPRGNYELLLLSLPTTVETHGWGRKLGVAVASVRCA